MGGPFSQQVSQEAMELPQRGREKGCLCSEKVEES